MKREEALQAGWFGELPEDVSDGICSIGEWVRFDKGDIIFEHGAEEADLYGLASGSICMHIAMGEHEQRLAHICGPGFWFGDFEFVSGASRMMAVEAAEDVLLLRVRRSDFLKLAKVQPDIWRWIALLAVQHITIAVGAADDLMLPSVKKRVAAVLLRLSGRRFAHPASKPMSTIYLTQLELAVAANLSRAAAGKILREMAESGAIKIDYGSIRILNPVALAAKLL